MRSIITVSLLAFTIAKKPAFLSKSPLISDHLDSHMLPSTEAKSFTFFDSNQEELVISLA